MHHAKLLATIAKALVTGTTVLKSMGMGRIPLKCNLDVRLSVISIADGAMISSCNVYLISSIDNRTIKHNNIAGQ